MGRQKYALRCKCVTDGCTETARYEYDSRADYDQGARRNIQWKCNRHTRPDEVLSAQERIKTVTYELTELEHGKYWDGTSGFVYGPGFKAYGKDFPVGTLIRVTAEIILPPLFPRHT